MDATHSKKILDSNKKVSDTAAKMKAGELTMDEFKVIYSQNVNDVEIGFVQKLALDLKKAADNYEKEISSILKKHGF